MADTGKAGTSQCGEDVADTNGDRAKWNQPTKAAADSRSVTCRICSKRIERNGYFATEPDVGRVAHGVPARVDRLRGLGNAVVPQVAEWIGRRIVDTLNG